MECPEVDSPSEISQRGQALMPPCDVLINTAPPAGRLSDSKDPLSRSFSFRRNASRGATSPTGYPSPKTVFNR